MLGEADGQIRLTNRSGYGRPVATVTVKGRDLGETLIRAGLAIPQPEFLKTHTARAKPYTEAFAAAQRSTARAFAGPRSEAVRRPRGDCPACHTRPSRSTAFLEDRGSPVRRRSRGKPTKT